MSAGSNNFRHQLSMVTAIQSLQNEKLLCDFSLKTCSGSFDVHRLVLAATTTRFKKLFASGYKEKYFEFPGHFHGEIVQEYIKFIYYGEITINTRTVEELLSLSVFLDFSTVKDACFNFLRENLESSCLIAIKLARTYKKADVAEEAESYVKANIENVSLMLEFPSVEKDDFARYLAGANADHKVLWQAFDRWTCGKCAYALQKDYIVSLLKAMKIECFPLGFLLENVFTRRYMRGATEYILSITNFSDSDIYDSLTPKNCFILRRLSRECSHLDTDIMKSNLHKYLARQFQELVKETEFVMLEEEELTSLLHSPDLKCTSEDTKLYAIMKWTLFDRSSSSGSRKRTLDWPKLFASVVVSRLSNTTISDCIKNKVVANIDQKCLICLVEELQRRADMPGTSRRPNESNYMAAGLPQMRGVTESLPFISSTSHQFQHMTFDAVSNASTPYSFSTASLPSDISVESDVESGIESRGYMDTSYLS